MSAIDPPLAATRRQYAVALGFAALLVLTGCSSETTSSGATSSASPTASTSSATGAPGTAGAGVARSAVQTQTGVAYATTSPSQTVDLYLPVADGSAPVPVVVLIHGGAFTMGDSGMEAQYAQALVEQGFAVAAVNYRLSGEALYPAGAQDVKAAVRWLRANAGQYGLDVTRFAAWGQSAGGWMAHLLGATGDQKTIFDDGELGNAEQSSAVQAVVSWFGPSDFTTMDEQAELVTACRGNADVHGTAGSPESDWLGEAVDTSAKAASTDLTSYLPAATTLPAWYLAHGSADCQVPVGQSKEMAAAVEDAGADATLVILDGAQHMDPMFDQTQLEPSIEFTKTTLDV